VKKFNDRERLKKNSKKRDDEKEKVRSTITNIFVFTWNSVSQRPVGVYWGI